MNMKSLKHVLAMLLVFCMVVSILPISALAVTDAPATPAQTTGKTIPVEYFTSTLYDWNQKGANNATAAADYVETGTREETHLQWSILTRDYPGVVFYAGYAVKVGDNYYPAYGQYTDGNSYSVYYRTDGATNQYYQNTNGQTLVATYDVPDTNAYITDPTGTLATETVNGTGNVIIFYGAAGGGYYEKKGFYFTDGTEIPDAFGTGNNNKDNYPAFSVWQRSNQNFHIYSGLAEKNLSDAENAPFSNDNVNAADLFSTTEYDWKNVYQNVKVPFYVGKEGTADEGYYILDSDKYGVYFSEGVNANKTESTMKIADQPTGYWAPRGTNNQGYAATGFLPFNNLTNVTFNALQATSTASVPSYAIVDGTPNNNEIDHDQNTVDYGFGMVTEVKFQMTDDGLDAKGNPITFEFAGDDDVWVYIDNKLVLDVGGTHDAIKGTINFVTGVVELTAPAYGKIGDIAKTTDKKPTADGVGAALLQQNLYGEDGALGTTLTGFSAQGEHTLKIYYMERGRGRTNCLIKFNLPQRDTIEVTKKLDHAMSDENVLSDLDPDEIEIYNAREFGFTLFEDGKTVTNKTFYVYDANNTLIRTASTNAEGHFTLHRNETARFLVDIGTNNSFYVVEDTMTKDADGFLTPTWTYTTNVDGAVATYNDATIENNQVTGFTGMTVTATGTYDGTRADTISFVCENYLSSNIPNPGIFPQGERIVIDYGLPITINVSDLLKNDIVRGDKTTVSLTDNGGDFGTAVYNNNGTADDYTDDTITYTLNKQLTGIETLTYQITVTGTGNEGNQQTTETATATANIQIMPATSMYYEENFGGAGDKVTIGTTDYIPYGLVSYSDVTTKWEAVKDNVNRGNQETGFVGTIDDSTYGSDTVYLTSSGDSYGTSMHAKTTNNAAQFVYDFTGTGTAIYGRVSPSTGYIRVKITNKDTNELVDTQFIDTIELVQVGTAKELYNIPIYLNNTLGKYDDAGYLITQNYHVEVLVYKKGAPTNTGYNAGEDFYLDGIRIFNPVVGNAEINTAYAEDGEANTVVINIRDKIAGDIKDGNVQDVFTLTDQYGTIIDNGDLADGDADYNNYDEYGPNTEFYLNNADTDNKVYTVSFKLINWDSKLYTLYIGMKAPAGNATVTVGGTVKENDDGSIEIVGGTDISLKNSADCYYDISDYVIVTTETVNGESCNVGTVTISGKNGLASLTNIKVTGIDEFTLVEYEDMESNGDGTDNDDFEIEVASNVLYMVPMTFSLRANSSEPTPVEPTPEEPTPVEPTPEEPDPVEPTPEEPDPVEPTPEEPDPVEPTPEEPDPVEPTPEEPDPVFEPKSVRVIHTYSRLLKRVTFAVTTSTDVSYITVNGVRVNSTRILGTNVFTYSVGNVKSGTVFEIVAYNNNGIAAEANTVTAK